MPVTVSKHIYERLFTFRGSKITAQGLRYALSGVVVYLVYFFVILALNRVFGFPVQVALVGGYAACVVTHFTLQRFFVWTDAEPYAIGARGQSGRYALLVVFQYTVTAISTSLLPGALGVPAVSVSLAVPAALAVSNFVILRNGIFHTS